MTVVLSVLRSRHWISPKGEASGLVPQTQSGTRANHETTPTCCQCGPWPVFAVSGRAVARYPTRWRSLISRLCGRCRDLIYLENQTSQTASTTTFSFACAFGQRRWRELFDLGNFCCRQTGEQIFQIIKRVDPLPPTTAQQRVNQPSAQTGQPDVVLGGKLVFG